MRAVVAHVTGLSDAVGATPVPSWLTVVTGGVLVGASFLFNSLLTDHEAIRAVNGWRVSLPSPDALDRFLSASLSAAGVAGLTLVLLASVLGPADPTTNVAVLVVWVGWWAGYATTTYLLGNTWPAVNPWRMLARRLPSAGRSLPEQYGVWPSVVGLLLLVWIEVVSPLATAPTALAGLIVGYTALTLAGASRYGTDAWFERVDPIARVFRLYGRLAPFQRTNAGVAFRLPGAALTDDTPTRPPGSTAFVVALLWVTTFDGLVATPAWNTVARSVLAPLDPTGLAGRVAVSLFYLLALVVGFGGFLGAYRFAAARSRTTVDSFLAPAAIERWFAPSLLPIAAGYHLAHSLGYVVTLSPALVGALAAPFGGVGTVRVAILPAWFGTAQLAVVVLGHLLAVWVAHALAMDLFPGVLRPIRSQYPFVVVMVGYTMTSAWVVGQPVVAPVYL
ncbi:hypothetical protein DU502_02035 [Haloplanus aerogenes]|uniref:Uncharacterized protein n=1 Tax=Haloplanus aerogenes TaxID=660522 RepID=A0A3G8QXI7_9EURY|nr:hypothetical protein DU502_02035 [Haloplanus aerogenes]